jgi:protein-glutamine gamma-glutamyltransferase
MTGMRLTWVYRVSVSLTLALACTCLGMAERPFFPGIEFLVFPLLLILILAAVLEDRAALPGWAANIAGVGIALGGGAWIAWHLYARVRDEGWESTPMPSALLPYLGPLLVLLLLVKLFRPKTASDHWLVHIVGLLLASLSCVLGTEPALGMVLAAYLASAVWHLSVFYIFRESIAVADRQLQVRGKPRENYAGQPESSWTGRPGARPGSAIRIPVFGSLVRATWWTAVALVVGSPLYLLLPRQGGMPWSPSVLLAPERGATPHVATTGFTSGIDLNRTGSVEVNEELAFTVQATDGEDRLKQDLDQGERWRGSVLDYYGEGHWLVSAPLSRVFPGRGMGGDGIVPRLTPPPPPPLPSRLRERALPHPSGGQFYVDFTISLRRAGGLFLADPVSPEREGEPETTRANPYPVVSLEDEPDQGPLFQELGRTLVPQLSNANREYRYRQVAESPTDVGPSADHLWSQLQHLRVTPPEEVQRWTDELMTRLAAVGAYDLTADDLVELTKDDFAGTNADDPRRRWIGQPRDPEKVARALNNYLAQSGEYTYSLDRPRADSAIDPTLDFLQNVKQGHCERFAGALALMLRSRGLLARVVQGYRGAELQEDGTYVIRQNFAHSWVEVLVPRPGLARVNEEMAAGGPTSCRWRWLTLDPTPITTAPPPPPWSWSRWWDQRQQLGKAAWKDFVVNYSADQQRAMLGDAWDEVRSRAGSASGARVPTTWKVVAGAGFPILAVAMLWLILRRLPRRARRLRAMSPLPPFYNRLLALLARHFHLRPQPGQTPRELGELARVRLTDTQRTASCADVPAQLVSLLYLIRYGGRPIEEPQRSAAELALDRLTAALAAGP